MSVRLCLATAVSSTQIPRNRAVDRTISEGYCTYSSMARHCGFISKFKACYPRPRRAATLFCTASSFHQDRLKKTSSGGSSSRQSIDFTIKKLETDEEIECVSWLRATAFYAYPEERKFAGEIHQMMIAEEESKALKLVRLDKKLDGMEKTVTIVALCDASCIQEDVDDRFCYVDPVDGARTMVVGSLDIYIDKALPGEVLIGDSEKAAYLANVCTASAARRQGVGASLLDAARAVAREHHIDDLFVHTMAVNEIAVEFYAKNGFIIEKEETSNQAHYRGRCLDGIEGRGRTVLLRDTALHSAQELPYIDSLDSC